MKIDIEYIKDILNVFLEAETAHITVNELKESGISYEGSDGDIDQKFLFHFQLLIENQLIGKQSLRYADLKDMGFQQCMGGEWSVCALDIRLTQTGHDFAQSLANKEVFSKLKSEFKDFPFKVIFDSGRKLLEHVAKKKMDKLLES
ncbi:DUF2513 domain-containing protein [Pseudoalteromonas sp. SR45-4]|uniref:DUF2513 domain-containing protein n=1 Tax=Pseudoalteromonas sp. SR45-4 TaxID=2760929 RepID=UPI0015F821CB|nr:DUF2513 domain-containing protein [Pseudoalteromonas sp. SR45-4]MBB1369428.1 DUF2513 domain-containing protein [Pseudoalteromonas sp. SR45-4]